MPKNILIDLNVILDVLLERSGFEASRDVIQLGEAGSRNLMISAHIVTTFAYLLENAGVPKQTIRLQVGWLLDTFHVIPVDDALLKAALISRLDDYEDAVIEGAAVACTAEAIITRNTKDFKAATVPAVTPSVYLAELKTR